jgi:hypothetical protein
LECKWSGVEGRGGERSGERNRDQYNEEDERREEDDAAGKTESLQIDGRDDRLEGLQVWEEKSIPDRKLKQM